MSRYQYNEAATVPAINAELEKIQEAIEDSLSRSGDTPNTMTAPLDMNGERIMNLPEAVSDSEPMRKGEAQAFVDAAAESAAEALASEQAAASSASAASASAASAAADADVADDLIQQLNSIYLGAFTTGPAVDNEGNPLQQGALYYNTVSKNLLVFNGTSWVISASQESAAAAELSAVNSAASAAAALASEQAAEAAEALAEQHKDAAFVSASAASGSATSAANSATVAGTAATNAGLSAVAAQTSNIEAGNSADAAADSADAAAASESSVAASATAAASSATAASSSASAAATSASNAAGSATAAATSETNAASSASSASASATSASNSAATALLYLNDTEAARDEVLQYSTAVSKGLVFIGLYDASTGVYPTLPVDIVGNPFWIISTGGTVSGVVLNPGDSLIYDVTNEVFIKLDTVDQVVSVAGKTGAVSLDKSDVGLANVDNTSDLNKPISTATQTALDLKVDDSQLATAATADSVAQRTSDGSLNVNQLNASSYVGLSASSAFPTTGIFNRSADGRLHIVSGSNGISLDQAAGASTLAVIDSSGNVGIGTGAASIAAGLHVAKGVDGIPAAGATNAAACFGNFNSANAYGLVMGAVGATGNGYISAQRTDGTATTYNLLLQPNGGNVGIGTASPSAALDIIGGIRLNKNGNLSTAKVGNFGSANFEGYIEPYNASGQTTIHNTVSSGFIGFHTGNGNTERMRIDSSGNVLVGIAGTGETDGAYIDQSGNIFLKSSSPNLSSSYIEWSSPFFTSGSQAKHGLILKNGTSDFNFGYFTDVSGSSGAIIRANGTNLGVVVYADNDGVRLAPNQTSWSAYSDERLKNISGEIDFALDKINAIRGVYYSWKKDDNNTQRCGLIAQEVEAVIPEIVDNDSDYKSVRYTEIIPLIVQGIKEQQEIIKAQGESIAALEARIEALEGDTNGSL